MSEKKCWMVRAGERGMLFDKFREGAFVAIGWRETGDLTGVGKDEVRRRLERAHPEDNVSRIGQATGVLFRFCSEMSVDDRVVTYNPSTREYLRGKVAGDYQFTNEPNGQAHRRATEWSTDPISRDDLTPQAKSALGSLMTVFAIPEQIAEGIWGGPAAPSGQVDSGVSDAEAEAVLHMPGEAWAAESLEMIKDRIKALGWLQVQHLVAAILRAMGGYKTKVAGRGEHGMDVIASSQLLVLGGQRIVAEVKHQQGSIGTEDIREFRGSMSDGDRGLFVSTGGFKKAAAAETHTSPLVELVDLDGLARLVIEYYDNFDPEGRALLPLVKIYWPV